MKLFVFGLGYSARHFALHHAGAFSSLIGTSRTPESIAELRADNLESLLFRDGEGDPRVDVCLADSDAVLVSVQPGKGPDPVLARYREGLAGSRRLRTIVYLSTIGVYGDHAGAWIDETAATEAFNDRQSARIAAETAWLDLGRQRGAKVVVLRLAGIYGPGRNALRDLREGEARRLDKPGQVFNRIHVDDIGRAIAACFRPASAPSVLNVTDDEPAPAPDVVAYAASLLGIEPPPLIPFAEAELSPMARSFYSANRRVSNKLLRSGLGVALAYPNYRAGLDALWAAGEGRG